ncbi:hypothetical protein, variant 13 [Aphanomyces astaci]|uniref:Uncharacterized protein n=1 Tax=Aphanomyces astaci TaxID=112090 RepID=W4FFJ0_APHAT|nr:hypothetical protein, variant 12 [Aphanomyces astaci]XP_009844997.1 hypothetical protein, variant 13 [Aphanomyces astaci]ETV65508.1 hypothetical protein, variant 12 [Aphanomyces astaci]ETV65509.1 hypothetical protein, variant 13 [Aphanomyces astaci]|eukprot:XP_009844996.1 hypothetical protein, variant 12 [Aphanomyces astaci]
MVSGRIRGNPTSSGALRSPVMPTKGAETNGLQPWGGQETADNGPSTSVDSTAVVRGPVASSSDDESEFVPSTTLLDNGILHIRGKGALGNRVTSSTTPATPLKRKYNNIKKVQKRKMLDSAQSTTPDTKRTKATSSYGPTNGYSKKVWASDSDDTEARGKKDAAAMLHEDWAWKEIDQDYMRLPSRKQMLYIHTLQQDACRTVVSNLGDLHGADNDSLVQPIMDARMCHIDGIAAAASSPLERPRRGRYYKDIWADVDYLDALKTSATHDTSEFETYTSNHDLVARYDDDAYEQFVHRLEGHPTDPRIRQHAKLGHDHHPAASLQTSATSCVVQTSACVTVYKTIVDTTLSVAFGVLGGDGLLGSAARSGRSVGRARHVHQSARASIRRELPCPWPRLRYINIRGRNRPKLTVSRSSGQRSPAGADISPRKARRRRH